MVVLHITGTLGSIPEDLWLFQYNDISDAMFQRYVYCIIEHRPSIFTCIVATYILMFLELWLGLSISS